MSATEVAIRSTGEDSTHTAEPLPEFEPDPVEFRERPESSRSRRESEPVEVREPARPAREARQQPFLLGLVDRLVELLSAFWDRLNSL